MRQRYFARLIALCLTVLAFSPAARAESAAEAKVFVQQNIDAGIAIMRDKALSEAQRRTQVHDLLAKLLDTKKIGLYALGPAAATAAPDQLSAYDTAFRAFMIGSYVNRLDGYGGQGLAVTGVIPHGTGDYVVTAVLTDAPGAAPDPDPVKVYLRVLAEGGGYAVVDAAIAGVWLGQAQRADFTGFLSQHGNSVPDLTQHIEAMTASFKTP